MGDDPAEARIEPGEDPEHHHPEADHADGAVKELAVKPELPLEGDRQGEDHDQRNPGRQQPGRDRADDPLLLDRRQEHPGHEIGQQDEDEHRKGVLRPQRRPVAGAPRGGQRRVPLNVGGAGNEAQQDLSHDTDPHRRRDREEEGVQNGTESAGPGKRFHVLPLLMRCGCAGSGKRSRYPKSAASPERRRRPRPNRQGAARCRCSRRPAPASSQSPCS